MKKLMISLAALTAIGAAVPAAAQTWGYGHLGYNGRDRYADDDYSQQALIAGNQVNDREARISAQITRGERSGRLTEWEVRQLRAEMGRIEIQEKQFRRRNFTFNEAAIINERLDRVEARLSALAQNDRYGYGYGYPGNNRGW